MQKLRKKGPEMRSASSASSPTDYRRSQVGGGMVTVRVSGHRQAVLGEDRSRGQDPKDPLDDRGPDSSPPSNEANRKAEATMKGEAAP